MCRSSRNSRRLWVVVTRPRRLHRLNCRFSLGKSVRMDTRVHAYVCIHMMQMYRLNWNLREFAPIHFLNYYYHKVFSDAHCLVVRLVVVYRFERSFTPSSISGCLVSHGQIRSADSERARAAAEC